MKHTQGKWVVDGHNLTAVIAEQNSDSNHPTYTHICDCNYGYAEPLKHLEINKANAKLIAAAPALLEALKLVLSVYPFSNLEQTNAKIKAYEAIKQATE